jgi:hypothetical protein
MTMQAPIANTLRWIAFVPGGILGGVLAGVAGLLFFGAVKRKRGQTIYSFVFAP